jgi:hypothetical protein
MPRDFEQDLAGYLALAEALLALLHDDAQNDSLGDESRATASGIAHREGKEARAGVAPAAPVKKGDGN